MKKEIILLRPHVAKFIVWQLKTPQIHLSNYNPITAYISVLMATEDCAFSEDEPELPIQYSEKMEVIIDLPYLRQQKRFFLTNKMTLAIDNFCHRLFIDFARLQMDFKTDAGDRKSARLAYLQRMSMSEDEIDEETVRRLVDFRRDDKRINPKMSNNVIAKTIHSIQKKDAKSVLTLFDVAA